MLEYTDKILEEIKKVFSMSNFDQIEEFGNLIKNTNKIVCVGAGRVGYATRGFAMRLKHMGKDAYMVGDTNVPSIGENDLLIVSSGSGETQTIYDLVAIAHKNGSKIALITGNPDSRMGTLANTIIQIRAPSKTKQIEGFQSIQPMTTLNEQSLGIFFDAFVLKLMEDMNETHDTMWERHSNLE